MRRLLGVLLVTLCPPSLPAADDAVQKELKSLQGKWKAVALEGGGKALPKEVVPDFVFVVEADGKTKGIMGKVEYQSKITIDPAKTPKTILHEHETGMHKGKKQFGVYKVEDGKWIVCMTAPGAAESDWPKSFETKDTKNVVFTFEKVKGK